MFWFFSWEGFRRRRGSTLVASVPPAAFRNGDFSSLLTQSNPDLFSGIRSRRGTATPAIERPALRTTSFRRRASIRPSQRRWKPSFRCRTGQVTLRTWSPTAARPTTATSYNVRWDYNLNQSNSFSFRYSRQNADLRDPQSNPQFTRVSQFDVTNYGANWVHVFSPTTTLEVGYGFNHPDGGGGITDKPITRADYLSTHRSSKCTRPRSSVTLWSTSALARIRPAAAAPRSLATESTKAEVI